MRGSTALLVFAASIGACADERLLPFPEETGAAKSIFLVLERGGAQEVYAYAGGGPAAEYSTLAGAAPDRVSIQLHQRTLAEMGLREGWLRPADPGTLSHRLPPPELGAFQAEADTWRRLDRAPLRAFWIPRAPPVSEPCPEIAVSSFELPREDWLTVHVPLGPGAVLFALASTKPEHRQRFFVARFDGETTSTTSVTTLTSSVPHGAGYRAEDGTIYVAGCGHTKLGRIDPRDLSATVPEICTFESWTNDGEAVVRMDGSSGGAPLEIVSMTRRTKVLGYGPDGDPYELGDLGGTNISSFVAWAGPGEAIGTDGSDGIFSMRRTGNELLHPAWDGVQRGAKYHRARRFPLGAAVAATDDRATGSVLVREEDTGVWRVIAEADGSGIIFELRPVEDGGFAYGGDRSKVGWWRPETGFCAAGPGGLDGHSVYDIAVTGPDQLFAVGFRDGISSPRRGFWVTRKPRKP